MGGPVLRRRGSGGNGGWPPSRDKVIAFLLACGYGLLEILRLIAEYGLVGAVAFAESKTGKDFNDYD